MKGILGRKIGMTRIFVSDGKCIPVTVIQAGPCKVINIRTLEKDGYTAVQLGFVKTRGKLLNKNLREYLKKNLGAEEYFQFIKEIRATSIEGIKIGDELKVTLFKPGDIIDVIGISKGRGFAGGVKRHHFHGGPGSHGSMFHRAPGSIGTNTFPGRVLKNRKLPGQMGNSRCSVKNLRIDGVMEDKNLLLIRGAVPGAPNGVLVIKKTERVNG
ncbi:MAG TPA: 50S ribosomal protein L3 [bacterium]|uniref:Large ribosomal subunit protein uL3 n=1 Tax=uncultured bacterium Rifle_16ft_4_minimus_4564 TaxID=1665161 RepID=A0A0H4T8R3_9BACT|nr:50S ribosomal protein L3, large subunit ribosomal protein L3 [uncultured bacterium Rifle_16ft_4_minimus_4564]